MAHYSSFVIKIWVDEGEMVRGEIRHTGTQEGIYFSDVGKMWEFVMNHLTPAPKDTAGHEQALRTS